jgi:hypothetical protein
MGKKKRRNNKRNNRRTNNFVIQNQNAAPKEEVVVEKNEETPVVEETAVVEETPVVEEIQETTQETVEKTQETVTEKETEVQEETQEEPNIQQIPEEEEEVVEEETKTAAETEPNIGQVDEETETTKEVEESPPVAKKKEREHLSDARWIKKYINKISHLFMAIDESLSYKQDFKQLRAQMDEVMDYKTTGFAIFADRYVREGHNAVVNVYLISEENWAPEVEEKVCTNIPEGSEKLTFNFHHDEKLFAANTAYQYFTELAQSKKVPGFMQYF